MARTLDVYLHNDLVGHLTQDDGGDMRFQYAGSWLQKPGPSLCRIHCRCARSDSGGIRRHPA
jgi:hypothetical protein